MNTLRQICAGPWLQHLGWTLVHFTWQAFLLGFILWLILRFSRFSAQVRYAIACVSLVLLALLPIVTFGLDARSQPTPSGALFTQADSTYKSFQQVMSGPLVPDSKGWLGAELSRVMSWVQPAVIPVALAWLISMAALFVRQAWSYYVLQRQLLADVEVPDSLLQARFDRLLETIGVKRARLVISKKSEVPATVGWFKPLVLVPAMALTNLPADYLEALIVHELAHIRRRDYFVNILQIVLEHVLFFHPVVWWISSVIRQERENCCDDIASKITGEARYARALATMEELRHTSGELAMAASGGSLFDRIARLLTKRPVHTRRSAVARLVVSALTIALSGILLVQTARSDEVWWQFQRSRGIGPAIYSLLELETDSTAFLEPLSQCLTTRSPTNEQLAALSAALMQGGDPNALLNEAAPLLSAVNPVSPDGHPSWRYGRSADRFLLTERMSGRAKKLATTDSQAAREMARATLALTCQIDAITGPQHVSRLFADPQFAVVAQLTASEAARLRLIVLSEREILLAPGMRLLVQKESLDEAIRSQAVINSEQIIPLILEYAVYAQGRIWMQRDIARFVWILRCKDEAAAAELKKRIETQFAWNDGHWMRMLNEAITTTQAYRPPVKSSGNMRPLLVSPHQGASTKPNP